MTASITHDSLFIDGAWTESSGNDRVEVISPSTEEVFGSVPSATREDVDAAVASARRAFVSGPWPHTKPEERATILQTVRAAIERDRERLAELVTNEMGAPIAQSRAIQVGVPLMMIDSFVELSQTFPFQQVRVSDSGSALVTREPVGVVAAIVPWNVPLTVAMMKLAPALLTGCTVVLKPALETPLSTLALARLFEEAGLPPGVVNVIPAGREVSEYLVQHPAVDKVTFTGSTAAGRRIASLCGENLKRVTLELGGKSAAVVLDDADLDSTVEALRLGSLRNSGQICSLKTRLLVSHRRHDEFIDRLRSLVESMPVGDPHDSDTQIGPMVSKRQRDVVNSYIAIGKEQGADAVLGGRQSEKGKGYFVDPTVFTNVTADMRIAQEEIFGPVLSVIKYTDEDEAIAIANDSAYGLNGAVFSEDLEHGIRVASRIRTGAVEINGNPVGFHSPVGGFKASGIGREAGHEGLEAYVEPRSLGLPRDFAEKLIADGSRPN
ncbi:aldehyde dehydrogenase [Rhodococcus rhodochrous]|uniref:Aldehyde dehydrogenase n=1 Tax=Rhodococcus rhodochrous TaxID=1829 RepID=A0AAW4XQB5_RHORH|nr:aldehyde dehydrogenase [Rhodococcus rhodochrous]MCD2114885.1 aldehyde dehydrogenase [Rhodococcus rhodochrous]